MSAAAGSGGGARAGAGGGAQVCDSWEDIDRDTPPALEQLKSMTRPPNKPINCTVNILVDENSYMMPEPAAIRILKRPESLSNGQLNGETRARPVKTLEQRQKEYEEARLRILGEARSPEDVTDENLSRILQDKLQTTAQPVKLKERPSPGTIAQITVVSRHSVANGVVVIRSPRGPDGTRGFSARR